MARLILCSVVGFLVAGCTTASSDSGEDDTIRSARPNAMRFAGDSHVGRLRWVAEHHVLEAYVKLGTPRNGIVPVAGGSDPEPDYGAPTKWHTGVLRLQDGQVMWRRAGSFIFGTRSHDGAGGTLVLGSAGGRAAFDLRTGRALSRGLPRPEQVLDDGTAVGPTANGDGLTRTRLRDGEQLWREPAAARYTHLVVGDGVVAASTDRPVPADGSSGSETTSQVSVSRLSDGRRLWALTGRAAPGPDAAGLPERTVIGIADQRVVTTDGTRLIGYRATDGKVRWSLPIRWHEDATFTVTDDRILIAQQGRVTAYRMADGTVDWATPANGLPDLSASAVSGGSLYAPVREESGLAVIDLRRGGISKSLVNVISGTYSRDVAVGDGTLLIQDKNRTMAFDLRR
jgi:outer membrane protein assembly factor BamB